MPVPRLRVRLATMMRWPRRTARLRFTAVYTSLFLVSGAALVAITYLLFQHATEYTKPRLPQIPRTPAIGQLQQVQLPQALFQLSLGVNQLIRDQRQLTVSAPAAGQSVVGGPLPPLAQDQQLLAEDQHQIAQDQQLLAQDQQQLTGGVNQLELAVRQMTEAGSVEAAQRAADSHQLLVNSAIALAIVAGLALLAGWVVAGRMLRPLRTITRTARRISSTSLNERLALAGPEDELKELGDTLDELFARLEAAFEAQRHFVANASHELRTPLTRERTLVQVALGDPSTPEVWRSTGEELLVSNREQEVLLEALLTLTSSEGGPDHRERTDLVDVCETVLARPRLDTDGLRLHLESDLHPAPLDGDPRLVERLVANLVDNAIGHNIIDGHVQVSSGVTEGRAVLSVTNTGPVVPPGEITRLFQPFQRLDGRRTHHKDGHGLGLSIVQAIAASHGAAVTATALPDGGLSVEVSFPPPLDSASSRTTGR